MNIKDVKLEEVFNKETATVLFQKMDEIISIDNEVDRLLGERKKITAEIAAMVPFKEGDKIECDGLTHGSKGLVVRAVQFCMGRNYFNKSRFDASWRISGHTLKKDGTPSMYKDSKTWGHISKEQQ